MIDLTKEIFGTGEMFFNKLGKPLYMDYNYFKGKYYNFVNIEQKGKRSKSICVYPGCSNKSVLSHVIPESQCLKNISTNGKVVYPKFNMETNTYSFEHISTSKASAFPGYCTEHEKLFWGFERGMDFTDDSIAMQNFRVICRDYFILNNRNKLLMRDYEKYKKEIFDYQSTLIQFFNKLSGKSIQLMDVSDEITEEFEYKMKSLNENIAEVEEDLLLYKEAYEKSTDDFINYVFNFPLPLPLALAGKSGFEVNNTVTNEACKFTIYLSILPSDSDSILIFSFRQKYLEQINLIISGYLVDFRMLDFIESFLIYGTDYWFINPEVWSNFSPEKQNRIKNDLLITSNYPTAELPYSIFDNQRITLINKYSKTSINSDHLEKLKNGTDKLNYFLKNT